MLRVAFRSLTSVRVAVPSIASRSVTGSVAAQIRSFSSSTPVSFFNRTNKPGEFTEEQAERIKRFGDVLKANPELSQLLDGFQTLLVEKGIQTAGKPPSLTQMMKMLADKDIRDHLSQLKDCLERSDVKINQQDLNALTDFYLAQKKSEMK